MKTFKRRYGFFLVFMVFLGIMIGSGTAAAEDDVSMVDTEDVNHQINLIYSKLDELIQQDSQNTWYYSVMDFDHDSNLEFFAATQHPEDRSTNLKVWEVYPDRSGLIECEISKDPEESFPDIITNAADTFHVLDMDNWYYMFYDNVVISPADVYTVKCSVCMSNGIIGYTSYATEHSELSNAYRYVSHMDSNGNEISEKQYNNSGNNAFDEAERSSTNFDWFTEDELMDPLRLLDSYAVFVGEKAAPAYAPISEPVIFLHDDLQPVWGTEGETDAVYMIITKNPTSEKRREGENLSFVSNANVYDSAYWTFVAPDGGEYDLDYFQAHFVYSLIDGAFGPTLTIYGVDQYMDGWGAYCTYDFKGQTACTSTAWIHVKAKN